MTKTKELFEILIEINTIANKRQLKFGKKLQHILLATVGFLNVKSGSIILKKNPKRIEVAASTDPQIIGLTHRIDENSPSTRVFETKKSVYIENISESDVYHKKYADRHEGYACLLVPILNHNNVIGVFALTDKIGQDYFSQDEQNAFLTIAGQVVGALENQRLMQSLKKQKRALHQKNLQLIQLEQLKTDFYNMLIHDLKGPISELVANLDILSYTVSDEDQECVEAAKAGCNTLYSMVSNLLDVSRFEDGKLNLVCEKIDPRELIEEALARLFGLVEMEQLSFDKKFPSDDSVTFFEGDRAILLRILQNLLTNAIRYSPSGETIEVGFENLKSSQIRFFVRDRGSGVPPEFHQSIFEKYFQAEKIKDGRQYTTGLGLTFCKMAVDAHGGSIGIESEPLKGSCFFFKLPVRMAQKRYLPKS